MWQRIKSFFQGGSVAKRVAIHAAIVTGFLSAVGIASGVFELRALKFAEGWRITLDPITCTKDAHATDLFMPPGPSLPSGSAAGSVPVAELGVLLTYYPAPRGSTSVASLPDLAVVALQEQRLMGQFHQVQQRIDHHFSQLITYYAYSFATTIMVGILAAIAAITLVFITLSGWQPSSEYKKTIFLLATVTATYSAAFPSIFELQKNIDDNRYLYLRYVSLANEICSYQATAETPDTGATTLNLFIHEVDTQLSNLNKIAAGTQANQIPDFSVALREAMGQASSLSPGNAPRQAQGFVPNRASVSGKKSSK
jgi:hypothetical protein